MTDPSQYVGRSASTIGRAMAAGDLSPVAFAEHLLDRASAQASPIFLSITRARALAEAEASEARLRAGRPLSPLDGVPIAWKDLIDMAGETTTAASDLYRDAAPAAADAPVVANAAAAGMVSLGKLNLTEFAYSGIGLNPHFGTPLNPNDPDTPRSPGGSSSGSGAAVAAGLVPIAIGTDTGGSVRIPAAFNGIVGFKSSEGRIEKSGVFPLSATLDTIGPLANTVEDCVLADMILRGAATSSVRRAELGGLALFVPDDVVLDDLQPAVAEAFEQSLARASEAGLSVRRGPSPEIAEAAALAAEIGTITAAEAYFEHRATVDGPDRSRVDRRVVARIDKGKSMSACDLIRLERARAAAMKSLFARLDGAYLAMPTAPHVAPEIAPLEADDDLFHRINLLTLRNTAIGNFLNLPGVAIPNGTDAAGMPTSFLLSGPGGGDTHLLGAALALEAIIRGPSA